MKKILVIAASLLGILPVSLAIACSCLPRTPQQTFESSQAVFAGQVVQVNQPGNREEVRVSFKVSRVWKGNLTPQLQVGTSSSSASCGYNFQKGEEYLVYASSEESKLKTGLCSGTKPLSTAQADLAALGEGKTPNRRTAEQ